MIKSMSRYETKYAITEIIKYLGEELHKIINS